MQVFRDPATDYYWVFADDVQISAPDDDGRRVFTTSSGDVLSRIPPGLDPAELPEQADPLVPQDPASVSRYQGREAMRLTPYPKEGRADWTLFDAFEELLNDPATPAYYRRAWDELQAFEWGSAMLHAAADVLGLTQAQRLDLFRLAASLKA